MHTQRSGPAAVDATASPEQPGRTAENHQTHAYYARTDQPCQSHTPVRFPVRTSNAAAWALFTLVVGTGLIVACVLLTLGAPS